MRSNFGFSEDYCSFHMPNAVRANFSEFHQFFPNFLKIDGTDPLQFFCFARIFKHYSQLISTTFALSLSFCGQLRRPWLWCGDSDDLHVRRLPRPHPPPRLSMVELTRDFAVLEPSTRRRGVAMASWVHAVHTKERSAVLMEERSGNGVLACTVGLQ
jgi:hypothetical protein